jgi:hypothetical protein
VACTAKLKIDFFGGRQIFFEPSWQHKFGKQSTVVLQECVNTSRIAGGAGWHCTYPTKVLRAEKEKIINLINQFCIILIEILHCTYN